MKLVAILFVVCIIVLGITYATIVTEEFKGLDQIEAGNTFRCYVFEEQIKSGMTLNEIEKVLDQYGPYTEGRADYSAGYYTVRIHYSEVATWNRFGGEIILGFSNDCFYRAWLPYRLDDSIPVCKR